MASKCNTCGSEFGTEDALAQHRSSRHGGSQKTKYAFYAVGAALILFAIAYFAFRGDGGGAGGAAGGNFASDAFVLEMSSTEGNAMHIHPNLEIVANGAKITIPTNIGIVGNRMSILHTHDSTGRIHVESPVRKDFTLRQFFLVWSQTSGRPKVFNSTCILDYCNSGSKTVKMSLNGQQNFEYENLILGDGDRIRIEYS